MNSAPLTSNNLILFIISALLFFMLFFGFGTDSTEKIADGVIEVPA